MRLTRMRLGFPGGDWLAWRIRGVRRIVRVSVAELVRSRVRAMVSNLTGGPIAHVLGV
jgi:hypothetical protein